MSGTHLRHDQSGAFEYVVGLVTNVVNKNGYHEFLSATKRMNKEKTNWAKFLLNGCPTVAWIEPKLLTEDKYLGC